MKENKAYFVGADVGTTGTRVSVYGADGQLASSAKVEYPLNVPKVGWAEQDPEVIFQAFSQTFKEAVAQFPYDKSLIQAFTFSTVFHSIFPVDKDGKPLHPMLIWADTRAQSCLNEIRESTDVDALYERTGCPLHPMYPIAKILWFRRERPELFQKTHKFVSIKEFLIHRLSKQFAVDMSIASGTGYFDSRKRMWDEASLKVMGIDESKLSEVYSTTHAIKNWNTTEYGLPKSVPLILGAGDGVLSTFGAGAIGPRQYTAMIGTSGAVRLCVDQPQTDPKTKNWCYNLTDKLWVVGGAINNGGLAFRWARDKFMSNEEYVAKKLNLDPYDVLNRYAEQKPAGSDGLIFLPFLSGERSPHWNANARGVLFGLNMNHGERHLIRATLEGITYSMFSVMNSLSGFVPADQQDEVEIRASGSFVKSSLWVQMMADIFGHKIVVPGEPQGSVFGAAALGMLATGHLSSPVGIRELVGQPRATYSPNAQNHETYSKLFKIYERIYANLLKEFDEIAKLQKT